MKHCIIKYTEGVIYAVMLSQIVSLASCAREDFDWLIGTPINVTATTENITRTGDNIQTANFEAGQTVNAYYSITGGDAIGNSPTTLTASAPENGKNILTPDVQPYYPSSGSVDIYALYPPTKVTSATTLFSVEPNQANTSNYKLSDLMWARVYGQAKTVNDVNLQFAHKMAKITISVTGQEGVTIKSIKLINTIREIGITDIALSTRALGALASPSTAAEKQIIVATSSMADGKEVLSGAALFPGQTIEADFIEVETNYGTTIFSAGNKTFVGGTEYTANLVITRQMIGFTATITDWTADNGTIAVPPGSSAGLLIENIPDIMYNGSAIEPELEITYTMNSVTYNLVNGVDYELQFFNNVNQGTATIIINGKADPAKIGSGDKGTEEAASAIAKIRAIKNFNIIAAKGNLTYPNDDGKVTVEYQYNATVDNPLDKHGGDGTITYESTKPEVAKVSETGVVTIVGAGTTIIKASMANDGNYSADDAQYELEVKARSLKNNYDEENNTGAVKISLPVSTFTYTGQTYRPMVTITDNGRTLLEGTHFTYEVTNATNAGTETKKGTIVISGKGNYSSATDDQVTLYFTINKADPNLQLANDAVKVAKGHSYTRRATAAYGANNITWSSEPSGYVTIDGGVVTAINSSTNTYPKTVTITATVPADANGNWDEQFKSYNLTIEQSEWEFTNPNNEASKQIQSWTCPLSGYYELEAMGARGGSTETGFEGGKGADIAGQVYITEGQVLYIYLGQAGTLRGTTAGFNGGGYYTGGTGDGNTTKFTSGGGATDFALQNATWSDNAHLYTRILVAGGGGGALYWYSGTMRSGDGGGGGGHADTYLNSAGTVTITSRDKYVGQTGLGGNNPGRGGTLSGGGAVATANAYGNAGTFGTGGNYGGTVSGGCGGGGWYGGASGAQAGTYGSGGGGSSFMFNSANVTAAGNNVNSSGKSYRTLLQENLPTTGNRFNPSTLEFTETTLVMGGAPNTESNPHGQARITYKSAE